MKQSLDTHTIHKCWTVKRASRRGDSLTLKQQSPGVTGGEVRPFEERACEWTECHLIVSQPHHRRWLTTGLGLFPTRSEAPWQPGCVSTCSLRCCSPVPEMWTSGSYRGKNNYKWVKLIVRQWQQTATQGELRMVNILLDFKSLKDCSHQEWMFAEQKQIILCMKMTCV